MPGKTRRTTQSAGARLRAARNELSLSLRDVVAISKVISKEHKNRKFAVSVSMLSSIEANKRTPNLYAIGSLARIYGRSLAELLSWYGVK